MGGYTHAQVIVILPIDEVMAALIARLSPIRDFVMPIAFGLQQIFSKLVLLGGQVGIESRQPILLDSPAHRRFLFESEAIKRKVFWIQSYCLFKRLPPIIQALSGQPVNEVEIQIIESGISGGRHRSPRLVSRM